MIHQPSISYASIVRDGKIQPDKIKPEGTTLIITPKEKGELQERPRRK